MPAFNDIVCVAHTNPWKPKPAVKKFICGMLSANKFDINAASLAAYKYRNDRNHPNQRLNMVARVGENWLIAASNPNPYTNGVAFTGFTPAIVAYQFSKYFYHEAGDGYSQEALNAGLDGAEHQSDTPGQLKDMCGA